MDGWASSTFWPALGSGRVGKSHPRGIGRLNRLTAQALRYAVGISQVWQRRTNVWRRVTNPAGGLKRQRGDQQSDPAMSNILKTIDLTDHAIRRAVFAVFDTAEHRANRKGSERLLRMQERDKHQVREFIGVQP